MSDNRNLTIEITSVPDKEQLVAEIWYMDYLIAEINQENNYLEIEFYTTKKNLKFSFEDFCNAIDIAKNKLLEG